MRDFLKKAFDETFTFLGSQTPWITVGMAVVIWVFVAAGVITGRSQKPDLDVVAALLAVPNDEQNWVVRGRVLAKGGNPVSDARVWAIADTRNGYRDSPVAVKTDDSGGFVISNVPRSLGASTVADVIIFASKDPPGLLKFFRDAATGATKLPVETKGPSGGFDSGFDSFGSSSEIGLGVGNVRFVQISVVPLAILSLLFFIGVFVPLIGAAQPWKYWLCLVTAFLLTVGMIVFISGGLSYVNTLTTPVTAERRQVLSLGFASIFYGRYVNDADPDWLLSFTAPPTSGIAAAANVSSLGTRDEAAKGKGTSKESAASKPDQSSKDAPPIDERGPLSQGFGAPLWTILIAVLGAGLTTISVIVKEISNRPTEEVGDLPKRLEQLARHQFFILFAPIGAIFVYQLMVAAKAAGQPVTVAIAILGAGLSLTALLDKAVTQIQQLFK